MTSYDFRCGKPRTSGQKGIAGSWNRKSRDLKGETADQLEKRIVGSRGRKNRGENAGSKSKVQVGEEGVVL